MASRRKSGKRGTQAAEDSTGGHAGRNPNLRKQASKPNGKFVKQVTAEAAAAGSAPETPKQAPQEVGAPGKESGESGGGSGREPRHGEGAIYGPGSIYVSLTIANPGFFGARPYSVGEFRNLTVGVLAELMAYAKSWQPQALVETSWGEATSWEALQRYRNSGDFLATGSYARFLSPGNTLEALVCVGNRKCADAVAAGKGSREAIDKLNDELEFQSFIETLKDGGIAVGTLIGGAVIGKLVRPLGTLVRLGGLGYFLGRTGRRFYTASNEGKCTIQLRNPVPISEEQIGLQNLVGERLYSRYRGVLLNLKRDYVTKDGMHATSGGPHHG